MYELPKKSRIKDILGSTDPDSEEADAKLEVYWIQEIEKEKKELVKKARAIQKQVDDNSIENALKNHPDICLKPRISFEPSSNGPIKIHKFGYPEANLQQGKELWIACYQGNLTDVERLLTITNIDLRYYLNVASLPSPFRPSYGSGVEDWMTSDMFQYNGYTSLHVACRLGFKRIVSLLLHHPHIEINVPALFYEERISFLDDLYLYGGVMAETTPLAVAANPEIHAMIRNHPKFDIERNKESYGSFCIIPLCEMLSFFTKHQANPHIFRFCENQLYAFYKTKQGVLSKEEISTFKQLLDVGVVFKIQSVNHDDPDFVSLLIQYKPNNDMLVAFQQFATNPMFNMSARRIADHLSWEQARNLSKNRRRVPSAIARKVLYTQRVKPVEVWALYNLRPYLNSNVMSKIAQFLLKETE
jgi:hypothetical protein